MKVLRFIGKFLLAYVIMTLFSMFVVEMMSLLQPYMGFLLFFMPISSFIGTILLMLYHWRKPGLDFKFLLLLTPLFAIFGFAFLRLGTGIINYIKGV